MNRIDFMKQLESLLQNISPAEREEALQYYNDYFNDAGQENEQVVIEALGNPAKVAENIKRDLYGSGYGDNAYQRAPLGSRAVVQYQGDATQQTKKKEEMSTWMIVLIVVLCVFASPIILGVGSSLLGALLSLIASWFMIIFSAGVAALVLLGVMLLLVIVGVICAFSSPLVGVALVGGGLVCGALGLLFLMLTVAMAGIATPAICRGTASLCRKLFGKKKQEQA